MSDDMGLSHDEHARLGAAFANDTYAMPVLDYGRHAGEVRALSMAGMAGLCDLTGMFVQLVEGNAAEALVRTACAGPRIGVGHLSYGAVLAGDGALVSVPLVMHTGANEYVLLDPTRRCDMLAAWLNFLVHVERDGMSPYASVSLTDASDVHVPLLLAGGAASSILADYVASSDELPLEGCVRSLDLDGRIRCLCLRLPAGSTPRFACYLLLVPPAFARILWRSLLSFESLVPIGRAALREGLARVLPWLVQVDGTDRVVVSEHDLRHWGLIRDDPDFVGARALMASDSTGHAGR